MNHKLFESDSEHYTHTHTRQNSEYPLAHMFERAEIPRYTYGFLACGALMRPVIRHSGQRRVIPQVMAAREVQTPGRARDLCSTLHVTCFAMHTIKDQFHIMLPRQCHARRTPTKVRLWETSRLPLAFPPSKHPAPATVPPGCDCGGVAATARCVFGYRRSLGAPGMVLGHASLGPWGPGD